MPSALHQVRIDDRLYRVYGRIIFERGHRAQIYKGSLVSNSTPLPSPNPPAAIAVEREDTSNEMQTTPPTESLNEKDSREKSKEEENSGTLVQSVVIKRTKYPSETERRELQLHRMAHPHPNVVALLDYKLCSRYATLILEHCTGDLFTFVQERDNTLIEDEEGRALARYFITDMLRAIEHCHSLGIVHRDVKSENIFMRFNGERISCALGDFGLAILEKDCEAEDCSGTLQCTAPEMLAGHAYDRRVDIWSAGVTVYEMLFGCSPFGDESDDVDSLLDKIHRGKWNTDSVERRRLNDHPQIRDLIKMLVQRVPPLRPSATMALKHPFLSAIAGTSECLDTSGAEDSECE